MIVSIKSRFYSLVLGLALIFISILISGISGAESIVISVDKTECFVFDEVNINVTIIPGSGGSYAYVSLVRINGSQETLFSHQKGCRTCGTYKPPLTSKILKEFKKNFTEPGVYEVWGEVTNANSYERNFTKVFILVKEKKVNLNTSNTSDNSNLNNSNLNNSNISNLSNISTPVNSPLNSPSNLSNVSEISNITACQKNGSIDAYFFYGQNCSDCQLVEPLVNEMCLKYNISFKFYEVSKNPRNEIFLEDFSKRYCIPKEKIKVPSIFLGDAALIGEKEIKEKLEEKTAFFVKTIGKTPFDPIKVNKTCFETPLYQKPPEKKSDKSDKIPVIAIMVLIAVLVGILALKYFRFGKR